MFRTQLLNYLIEKYKYESYLEIGIDKPEINHNNIKIKHKVGVDPSSSSSVTFSGTSDEYFNFISSDTKFDLIFIDGLHLHEQLLVDIDNSLKHLNDNGTIVCHDSLPHTEVMQFRERESGLWTGDVWKAVAKLRMTRTDLTIKTVDTDHGLTIIKKGHNELFDDLTYEFFIQNRNQLMNVISIEEFLNQF